MTAVAHDAEHFSPWHVGVAGRSGARFLIARPITSNPPEHGPARRLQLPFFAPQEIARYTRITRDIARELLTDLRDEGRADAAAGYAQHIPVRVISAMDGIPREDETRFTDWVAKILHVGPLHQDVSLAACGEILHYFAEQLEQRRGDILSFLLDAPHRRPAALGQAPAGHVLPPARRRDQHHVERHRAQPVAPGHAPRRPGSAPPEPELLPIAVEELLPAYSPVRWLERCPSRWSWAGGAPPRREGAAAVAGRQPGPGGLPRRERAAHRPPGEPPRRLGCGHPPLPGLQPGADGAAGRHEDRLAAVPNFRLADEAAVTWTGGQVRGPLPA